jgi:glutaconate CoA-transferase subunit B
MATDCTESELMAVLLSREVRNGEVSACGAHSMIPAAALLLAKARHAPDAELIILRSPFTPFKTTRQFHFLAMRGEMGLFFVSGVQIDRHANYNLHQVGPDPDRPTLRLPGGYGGGMIYYAARRTIVFRTEHSPRTFVERVDFISAAGNSPPDVERPGHPSKVITPLATLRFERAQPDGEGVLRLESVHPPHTVAEAVARTGFDLGDVSAVPATEPPRPEELDTLRRLGAGRAPLAGRPLTRPGPTRRGGGPAPGTGGAFAGALFQLFVCVGGVVGEAVHGVVGAETDDQVAAFELAEDTGTVQHVGVGDLARIQPGPHRVAKDLEHLGLGGHPRLEQVHGPFGKGLAHGDAPGQQPGEQDQSDQRGHSQEAWFGHWLVTSRLLAVWVPFFKHTLSPGRDHPPASPFRSPQAPAPARPAFRRLWGPISPLPRPSAPLAHSSGNRGRMNDSGE